VPRNLCCCKVVAAAGKGERRAGLSDQRPVELRAPAGWVGARLRLEAMAATVRLSDIVDALEMQFDESSSFLDRDTGQVETVSHELLGAAEESGEDEEPDLPK